MKASSLPARTQSVAGVLVCGFLIGGLLSGCSQPAREQAAPPAGAAAPATPASSDGPRRVFGRAPTANGQPSIVILLPSGGRPAPAQASVPVMDQAVMTFLPPTLFVRTGQPVEFRNNDDVLHNVNVKDEDNKVQAFNVAIPTGANYTYTFATDGFYGVRCDIHPAMWALVVSTSSPYAMQTDESGAFAFENVDTGSYTVRVYAGARMLERAIEVTSDGMEVSFAAN